MSHHRTGLLLDDIFRAHETGAGHPECSERYVAITGALTKQGITDEAIALTQQPAEPNDVMLCHTRDYFATARKDIAKGAHELSTGDTQVCARSFDIALRAVGGVMNAVDEVMSGNLRNAFCAVRPPGHHARPAQGMGFCVFNNIAIGARHAQKKHGAGKVMIVDWDVHHGNGTQDIFYEDGSVLFFSTHQSPWYPFTGHAAEHGEGQGRGSTINAPLPAGSGMKEISAAIQERLIDTAQKFQPDLVMISAGFDSRKADPLGQFQLGDEDFASLTKLFMKFADENCGGRIVSVLEGGYNVAGLASAVSSHMRALMGD